MLKTSLRGVSVDLRGDSFDPLHGAAHAPARVDASTPSCRSTDALAQPAEFSLVDMRLIGLEPLRRVGSDELIEQPGGMLLRNLAGHGASVSPHLTGAVLLALFVGQISHGADITTAATNPAKGLQPRPHLDGAAPREGVRECL